jgi:hypothetical protein
LECDEKTIADVIRELPVSKCETLFSFLLKKMSNQKLQINTMKWISIMVDQRPQLFLQNQKLSHLANNIKLSSDTHELIGKLEMIV